MPANEGYLLIDTGYDKDYQTFKEKFHQKNIKLQELSYLLLIHHHDDHAGFVNQLRADTNLQVIAHKEAVPLLQSGKNDQSRGGGYLNKNISWQKIIDAGAKWIYPSHGKPFPVEKLEKHKHHYTNDSLVNFF